MEFEWDPAKALSNQKKHGISFEEATGVFDDNLSSTVLDPDHSVSEFRFLIFGLSKFGKYLVVSFTERNDRIRIISARCMSRHEIRAYEQ